jgi:hypothetical protein
MKKCLRLALGLLLLGGLLVGGWAVHRRPPPRLRHVEVACWSDWDTVNVRTNDADCLARAEAWFRSLPGPSPRQRWLRFRGCDCQSALRMADYRLTLVFEGGRREEVEVWADGPARDGDGSDREVLVRHDGYEILGPGPPFRQFARSLPSGPC